MGLQGALVPGGQDPLGRGSMCPALGFYRLRVDRGGAHRHVVFPGRRRAASGSAPFVIIDHIY